MKNWRKTKKIILKIQTEVDKSRDVFGDVWKYTDWERERERERVGGCNYKSEGREVDMVNKEIERGRRIWEGETYWVRMKEGQGIEKGIWMLR